MSKKVQNKGRNPKKMLEDLLKGNFMPKGEPFHNKASKDYGVLMFHGLMGSPYQVRELGDFLYKQGIPNFGFCTVGHGTNKKDLIKTNRKDWLESATTAYQEFNKVYPKTIVLGFSLGGLLALNLSKEFNPKGTVTIAAPYNINIMGNLFAMTGFHKRNPEDMVRYLGMMPLKTKYEIIKFTEETKEVLPLIENPILIFQGTSDKKVSKNSSYKIYGNVKSKHKKVSNLIGEEHLILKGKYKKQVFNKIHDFILECI